MKKTAMLCFCRSGAAHTLGMLCCYVYLRHGAVHSRGYLGQEYGNECMIENEPFLAFFIAAYAMSLLIFFAAVPLGFPPGLFWRCPCCGHPFPYYVPTRGDNLKEKECLLDIKGQHIRYAKLKFCPLILPSVCPECKCRFFDMADDFLTRGR